MWVREMDSAAVAAASSWPDAIDPRSSAADSAQRSSVERGNWGESRERVTVRSEAVQAVRCLEVIDVTDGTTLLVFSRLSGIRGCRRVGGLGLYGHAWA